MKIKKILIIILISIMFFNVFSVNVFATDITNNSGDKLFLEYNKYLERMKNAKTGKEQNEATKDFYSNLGVKAGSKEIYEIRMNKDGIYEVINSFILTGEETDLDIYSINEYILPSYVPGDMRLIVTHTPVASGFTDSVDSSTFKNLLGLAVELFVGEKAPAIGIACDLMSVLGEPTAPYYLRDNIISTSNDLDLYLKNIEVYTSSGEWYTYVQSGRLDTNVGAVHRYHDGIKWRINAGDYYYDMQVEEGEFYSDHLYLYEIAEIRYRNNSNMFVDPYYLGPVFVDEAKLKDFKDWESMCR